MCTEGPHIKLSYNRTRKLKTNSIADVIIMHFSSQEILGGGGGEIDSFGGIPGSFPHYPGVHE